MFGRQRRSLREGDPKPLADEIIKAIRLLPDREVARCAQMAATEIRIRIAFGPSRADPDPMRKVSRP